MAEGRFLNKPFIFIPENFLLLLVLLLSSLFFTSLLFKADDLQIEIIFSLIRFLWPYFSKGVSCCFAFPLSFVIISAHPTCNIPSARGMHTHSISFFPFWLLFTFIMVICKFNSILQDIGYFFHLMSSADLTSILGIPSSWSLEKC